MDQVTGYVEAMTACGLLGHRYRFTAQGTTMSWACERCGAAGGAKEYPTPERARHFAGAFDVEDRHDLGRRAPWLGLFPLRIWRAISGGSRRSRAGAPRTRPPAAPRRPPGDG